MLLLAGFVCSCWQYVDPLWSHCTLVLSPCVGLPFSAWAPPLEGDDAYGGALLMLGRKGCRLSVFTSARADALWNRVRYLLGAFVPPATIKVQRMCVYTH